MTLPPPGRAALAAALMVVAVPLAAQQGASAPSAAAGKAVFDKTCKECHGTAVTLAPGGTFIRSLPFYCS